MENFKLYLTRNQMEVTTGATGQGRSPNFNTHSGSRLEETWWAKIPAVMEDTWGDIWRTRFIGMQHIASLQAFWKVLHSKVRYVTLFHMTTVNIYVDSERQHSEPI
jgi:hypothetical protein